MVNFKEKFTKCNSFWSVEKKVFNQKFSFQTDKLPSFHPPLYVKNLLLTPPHFIFNHLLIESFILDELDQKAFEKDWICCRHKSLSMFIIRLLSNLHFFRMKNLEKKWRIKENSGLGRKMLSWYAVMMNVIINSEGGEKGKYWGPLRLNKSSCMTMTDGGSNLHKKIEPENKEKRENLFWDWKGSKKLE